MSDNFDSFILSGKGLSNVAMIQSPSDFQFIVGEHTYETNRFCACFISSKITRILMQDPLISSFTINQSDENYEFNLIMRILEGEDVNITDSNAFYILAIANELGNEELKDKINSFILTPLTKDNVFIRLKQKTVYNLETKNEIDFIAANLTSLNEDLFDDYPTSFIERLLSSPKLCVSDEDSLFQLIINLINKRGQEAEVLLNYVFMELLSDEMMEKFQNTIPLQRTSAPVLLSMKNRLIHKMPSEELIENRYQSIKIRCPLNSKEPLKGIFDYLFSIKNKNPHTEGIIEITASSSSSNSPQKVILPGFTGYWASSNSPNQNICFNFKSYKVIVEAYSIKTRGDGDPISWEIQGSNDKVSWKTIDSRNTNLQRGAITIFDSFPKSNEYQYIQMIQKGPNSRGDHYFNLSRFELFGALTQKNDKKQ